MSAFFAAVGQNLTSGDARRLLARRSVIDGALLASLTTHSLAQLCARVLRACRAVRVIAVVTRTRCPVLKLCHVESGIACDVSFGSGSVGGGGVGAGV